MEFTQPSYEIWLQEPGLDGMYRQIERAGRVCYKSEDHRTEDSARPFCERMLKSRHTAMLEHGTVYLTLQHAQVDDAVYTNVKSFYTANHFSMVAETDGQLFVTTNLRVMAENDRMDDLQFFTEPASAHHLRITVHFTTQVGTTREFNRHRDNSMAEQSTRYCNYAKDKFGSEISVNLPVWVRELMGSTTVMPTRADLPSLLQKAMAGTATEMENWLLGNLAAELSYMNLVALGRRPQEARAVLPLDLHTELVHTAFVHQWKHFFDLRAKGSTGAPHPDAKVLAWPLYREFIDRGWLIEDVDKA